MASSTDGAAVQARWRMEVDSVRRGIDRRMHELLCADSTECRTIGQAMRDSTLIAGKRIRPLLLVLTARGLGCDRQSLLDLSCAIEMVHCASLILDDLPCMDDAYMRRGQPTLHRRYGEDVAALTTVSLLMRAFACIASPEEISPVIRLQMSLVLSEATGSNGLVRGQYEDLHDSASLRPEPAVMRTNELKTASLFRAAVTLGALAAEADQRVLARLDRFACDLGLAFQLFDDLNDNNPASGKDMGQDEGKVTLLTLLGETIARERLIGYLHSSIDQLEAVFDRGQPICCFVREQVSRLEECLPVGQAGGQLRRDDVARSSNLN